MPIVLLSNASTNGAFASQVGFRNISVGMLQVFSSNFGACVFLGRSDTGPEAEQPAGRSVHLQPPGDRFRWSDVYS